jgi:peroxiredoxin (alkyl hydroperoxide reductase subunit C)
MDGTEDMTCYDWFFCTKKISKEEVEAKLRSK